MWREKLNQRRGAYSSKYDTCSLQIYVVAISHSQLCRDFKGVGVKSEIRQISHLFTITLKTCQFLLLRTRNYLKIFEYDKEFS